MRKMQVTVKYKITWLAQVVINLCLRSSGSASMVVWVLKPGALTRGGRLSSAQTRRHYVSGFYQWY